MLHPRDSAHGRDELAPQRALLAQEAAALGRERVVAAPHLAGLLEPAARDQPAPLQPPQHRVEGRDPEAELAGGALLDQLADLVAVAGARLQQRQHQQLGAALLQLAAEHPGTSMLLSSIY